MHIAYKETTVQDSVASTYNVRSLGAVSISALISSDSPNGICVSFVFYFT